MQHMTVLSRRFSDEFNRFVDIERLRQVFECTALVRGDCILEVRVGGYDDHRKVRADAAQAVEQRQAVHTGHAHIRDQHIRRFFFDGIQKMFATLETPLTHVGLAQSLF
jgi:hypothetical protein